MPEPIRRLIGSHHAYFPLSGKAPPDLVRGLGRNPASSIAAQDEELRHIPCARSRSSVARLDHDETGETVVGVDEEGQPVGVLPADVEIPAAKSAVGPNLPIDKLAEVVRVELQQVVKHLLLLHCSAHQGDLHVQMLWFVHLPRPPGVSQQRSLSLQIITSQNATIVGTD